MTTDQIITEYKNAYFDIHGKFPTIEKRGSWIYINNLSPRRAKDILELTKNLLFQAKKQVSKDEYSEIECLMNIKKEAKFIFGSTNVKKMQISAKKIVKMITTFMNIQE